jgi:hypothetical protein
MYVATMDVFRNRWFTSYEDARAARAAHGGWLFPFGPHCFITDAGGVRELASTPRTRTGRASAGTGCDRGIRRRGSGWRSGAGWRRDGMQATVTRPADDARWSLVALAGFVGLALAGLVLQGNCAENATTWSAGAPLTECRYSPRFRRTT